MNRYPPRRSQADFRGFVLALLAAALLLALILPLPASSAAGVDQPMKAPAGFAL